MMIDLFVLLSPHIVNKGMKKNLKERNNLGKDEPDVNHLDIGGGRKASRDTYEEGCKDKEGSEVHTDNSFKEEGFEEVCNIDNDENQHGG